MGSGFKALEARGNVVLLVALVCCLALGMLAGCGSGGSGGSDSKASESEAAAPLTDEKLVTQAVDTEIAAAKNLETDSMKKMLEETAALFDMPGVDANEIVKAMLANLAYTVDDIEVEGSSATATVNITNTDTDAAIEKASVDLEAWQATVDSEKVTEEQLGSKASECIIGALKDTTVATAKNSVAVTFTKASDGTWTINNADELTEGLGGL